MDELDAKIREGTATPAEHWYWLQRPSTPYSLAGLLAMGLVGMYVAGWRNPLPWMLLAPVLLGIILWTIGRLARPTDKPPR